MSVLIKMNFKGMYAKQLKEIQTELKALPKEAHKEFVALTPIDRGNARRKTKLEGNVINANYPYAQRLNEGWSKQAPKGMEEPWNKWLEKRLNKIIGRRDG